MAERIDTTPDRPHYNLNAARDAGYRALERLDAEQALQHKLDRVAPARRARFPKDDRRSSERPGMWLTERERSERWPLG